MVHGGILAVSDPGLVAITVAVIGTIGAIGAAYAANRARTDIQDRIGTPNGQGNLVQMCERILAGQAGQDNRIARLEGEQLRQAIDLAAQDQRLRQVEATTTD